MRFFTSRLRQGADDPNATVTANGGFGIADLHPTFNGWMYENFPHQEGRPKSRTTIGAIRTHLVFRCNGSFLQIRVNVGGREY